ncbi:MULTISPECIES: DUF1016 N-terminal domain-containing protein [unclassified Plantibacter]|uniref:DUF1016 N-terminal domain-containing protein n=1 Tax=unclassified Plantibacter TaxID=2624265 RepID=UPI00177C0C0E|nr:MULTISPECIES: DUF1016 N-terminal domain-containing protein [unclassified Plantibacter]MBD8101206.1 hypothetical protein [Plantibacter sp. CFBP 8775]MBD8517475.1 hypothetical protein [Plantibacter sp. CFBP 8804]
MRPYFEAWPDPSAIRQRPVGALPWGHVIEILGKLDDPAKHDWCAATDVHDHYGRSVLADQITKRLHERETAAPTSFSSTRDSRA